MRYIKLIGIVLFVYILSRLDYAKIIISLKDMDGKYLFYYMISFYIFFISKVFRWHLAQNYFSKPLSFFDNYFIFLETVYIGFVTPGKVGDVTRVWLIKERFNIDKKDTMVAYIFDRIQDIIFLIIFAIYGTIFVIDINISSYTYVAFGALILLYVLKNRIIKLFSAKFETLRYINVDINFEIKIFFLNLFIYFFYFAQAYLLSKSLHLNIPFRYIIAVVSISSIASLIPISINGLGVREGLFIYLLSKLSIQKESAVLFSLLDNVVFLALFIILLHIVSKFARIYLKKHRGSR